MLLLLLLLLVDTVTSLECYSCSYNSSQVNTCSQEHQEAVCYLTHHLKP